MDLAIFLGLLALWIAMMAAERIKDRKRDEFHRREMERK
jgi:4-hydroxybenzoate polyprenyltransferase